MKGITIRLVMLSKADRNGLYPVYFCITINRKRKYLFTGYRVKEKDWDPVSNGRVFYFTKVTKVVTKRKSRPAKPL